MDKILHNKEIFLNLVIIIIAIAAQFALLVLIQGNNHSASREGFSKADVMNQIKQDKEFKVRSYQSLAKKKKRLV